MSTSPISTILNGKVINSLFNIYFQKIIIIIRCQAMYQFKILVCARFINSSISLNLPSNTFTMTGDNKAIIFVQYNPQIIKCFV